MPTYEYECTKCGHGFETFQNMREEPLKECPRCSSPVKRLLGVGAGIIFKGPGFYATDYKAKERIRKGGACPKQDKNDSACKGCNAKINDE